MWGVTACVVMAWLFLALAADDVEAERKEGGRVEGRGRTAKHRRQIKEERRKGKGRRKVGEEEEENGGVVVK